ncbi:Transcription termination factor MTERF2, chloroplastic, partial [Cucurbita argyrosperma subsp. sororia]
MMQRGAFCQKVASLILLGISQISFSCICPLWFSCNPLLRYQVSVIQNSIYPRSRHRQAFASILVNQKLKVASCSTVSAKQVEEKVGERPLAHANDSTEVFRRWGCADDDIAQIFARRPSLRRSDLNLLQDKLQLLQGVGITSPDLVKIINCHPRFLKCRINNNFHERIEFFLKMFESKEALIKAIVKNPLLLTYDFHNKIKPAISQYEELGLSRKDLILMLLSRPTLIPRSSFNDEKMGYIQKTGLTHGDKMYKYIVTIIGISRLETIRQKVAHLEKFGFTEDETFSLLGRSPLILTLSVDKVQRNMTFILCTLKLPAKSILNYPFLLYLNLEAVLKPRVLLSGKMEEMGLDIQIKGGLMLRALRMTEKRNLKEEPSQGLSFLNLRYLVWRSSSVLLTVLIVVWRMSQEHVTRCLLLGTNEHYSRKLRKGTEINLWDFECCRKSRKLV